MIHAKERFNRRNPGTNIQELSGLFLQCILTSYSSQEKVLKSIFFSRKGNIFTWNRIMWFVKFSTHFHPFSTG